MVREVGYYGVRRYGKSERNRWGNVRVWSC